jgi:hypothetical protein
LNNCLEGRRKGLETERGRRRGENWEKKRRNTVKLSPNLIRFKRYGSYNFFPLVL